MQHALAFCEEWGRRGYLLTRLRERMGTWPILIIAVVALRRYSHSSTNDDRKGW